MSLLEKYVLPEVRQHELTATVGFQGELRFKIRYLNRLTLREIGEKCTFMDYDRNEKARKQQMDFKKFSKMLCEAILVGWEGVTLRALSKLMALDLEVLPKDRLDEQIPFALDEAQVLVEKIPELDAFLQTAALDISLFQSLPRMEAEMGNSSSSSSGSTVTA